MNALRFNRHELFTTEMLSETSRIINTVQWHQIDNDIQDYGFINSLYGLYDGYLYTNILLQAMEYPSEIYERVLNLYATISNLIDEQQ
jgi:hypothetical protein